MKQLSTLAILCTLFCAPLSGHHIFVTNQAKVTIEVLRGKDHTDMKRSCLIEPGRIRGFEEDLSRPLFTFQWQQEMRCSTLTHATTFKLSPLNGSLNITYLNLYPLNMIEINRPSIDGLVMVVEKVNADGKIQTRQYSYVPRPMPLATGRKA